jgi:hypothetical protein
VLNANNEHLFTSPSLLYSRRRSALFALTLWRARAACSISPIRRRVLSARGMGHTVCQVLRARESLSLAVGIGVIGCSVFFVVGPTDPGCTAEVGYCVFGQVSGRALSRLA